jgi:4-hydroxybenzoate polyprenyltransferase
MSLPVSELTPQSPWLLRWRAYLKERFPLMAQVLLIISYYSSNQFLAQVLLQPQQPIHYSLRSLLGGITLLCFFFHLRVFDEHKDFKEDCKYFPQRVLQRGIITLKELRIIGGLAIAWELVVGFLLGPAVFVAVVIALGYSLLMLKEFFLKNWLKKKFLIYASVHMMIMPLLAVMIFSFVTHRYPWEAPSWYWLYAWVGFFVCFNWEISRKIRSPEQEIEGVDSYTNCLAPMVQPIWY